MIFNPDEIIRKAQKALKDGKSPASALTAIGMSYYEKDLLDKAIFYYSRALKIDPIFSPAYAGLGIVYGKKGLVTESIFNLKEAIRLEPSCALLYNWLGDAYFDLGKLEEAIKAYSKAIELNSLDSNAHNDLADAYRLKGDFKAALNHYQKTLEIDALDTNAMLESAQVMVQLGEGDQAKVQLEKLLARFPETVDAKTAQIVLASIAAQEGKFETAKEHLTLASKDFPFNPVIQFHLGLCRLMLEDPEGAEEHFQRVLDLDPNNPRANKLLLQLRKKKSQ